MLKKVFLQQLLDIHKGHSGWFYSFFALTNKESSAMSP